MTAYITVKELRQNLVQVEQKIKQGQSYIVIKRSKPIFKLSPLEADEWEEVVNFTKINRGGVDIADLLKRL